MTGGETLSGRDTLLEKKGERNQRQREKIDRGSHLVEAGRP
jgi:hypothetical protein